MSHARSARRLLKRIATRTADERLASVAELVDGWERDKNVDTSGITYRGAANAVREATK